MGGTGFLGRQVWSTSEDGLVVSPSLSRPRATSRSDCFEHLVEHLPLCLRRADHPSRLSTPPRHHAPPHRVGERDALPTCTLREDAVLVLIQAHRHQGSLRIPRGASACHDFCYTEVPHH